MQHRMKSLCIIAGSRDITDQHATTVLQEISLSCHIYRKETRTYTKRSHTLNFNHDKAITTLSQNMNIEKYTIYMSLPRDNTETCLQITVL